MVALASSLSYNMFKAGLSCNKKAGIFVSKPSRSIASSQLVLAKIFGFHKS
jgi:hypothetical protein